MHCSEEERDEVLYYMLAAHPGRTLVFVNAVSTARRVAALLRILQMPSAALHAGMSGAQAPIEAFSCSKVLMTTLHFFRPLKPSKGGFKSQIQYLIWSRGRGPLK